MNRKKVAIFDARRNTNIINTIIEHDRDICNFIYLSDRVLIGSNCKIEDKKHL